MKLHHEPGHNKQSMKETEKSHLIV
eukprot:Gb_23390 [translate_table: standard]